MLKEQVRIGGAVALPIKPWSTTRHLQAGVKGCLGYVLAYGKYRIRQTGLCETFEAVPSESAAAGLVVYRQVPERRPDRGSFEIDGSTEWTLDFVSLRGAMPWDEYMSLRSEHDLIALEVQALNERQVAIKNQIKGWCQDIWMKIQPDLIENLTMRLDPDFQWGVSSGQRGVVFMTGNLPLVTMLTPTQKAEYEAMTAEYEAITEKLTCRRVSYYR